LRAGELARFTQGGSITCAKPSPAAPAGWQAPRVAGPAGGCICAVRCAPVWYSRQREGGVSIGV